MNECPKEFFNNLYYELFMKRTIDGINQEVNIIEEIIGHKKINSILDVCCGIGDIAHELGRRNNVAACGIEYSSDYVNRNMLKNIIQGDARQKQTDKNFSLVLNWFSSFSYFNEQDNYKILKNCFDYCNLSLPCVKPRPSGNFVNATSCISDKSSPSQRLNI